MSKPNHSEFRKQISNCNNIPSEQLDWGTFFEVETEIEALRIAYAFRNCPHGVQVRAIDHRGTFSVTVFNELATTCGIDRS